MAAAESFLAFNPAARAGPAAASRRRCRGPRNRKKGWKRWGGPEARLGREIGDFLEDVGLQERAAGGLISEQPNEGLFFLDTGSAPKGRRLKKRPQKPLHVELVLQPLSKVPPPKNIGAHQIPNGRKEKRRREFWAKKAQKGIFPRGERRLRARLGLGGTPKAPPSPPRAPKAPELGRSDPHRAFYDIWGDGNPLDAPLAGQDPWYLQQTKKQPVQRPPPAAGPALAPPPRGGDRRGRLLQPPLPGAPGPAAPGAAGGAEEEEGGGEGGAEAEGHRGAALRGGRAAGAAAGAAGGGGGGGGGRGAGGAAPGAARDTGTARQENTETAAEGEGAPGQGCGPSPCPPGPAAEPGAVPAAFPAPRPAAPGAAAAAATAPTATAAGAEGEGTQTAGEAEVPGARARGAAERGAARVPAPPPARGERAPGSLQELPEEEHDRAQGAGKVPAAVPGEAGGEEKFSLHHAVTGIPRTKIIKIKIIKTKLKLPEGSCGPGRFVWETGNTPGGWAQFGET
ncbi:ribosome biogenesis protein NOP53 isoform X1 [Chamaea fasciata]|uniref:ribosome biogenesis protein NOP53 isoform X1 n=1 Tax=Chamaea fasciata TaxID=190680 RepID=UPI003369F09E